MERFRRLQAKLLAWRDARGRETGLPGVALWLFNRRVYAGLILVFVLGWGLGFSAGRFQLETVLLPAQIQKAGEGTDKAAAETASSDPQPTETSPYTVVEDEPFGPAQPSPPAIPSPPANAAVSSVPAEKPAWQRFAVPAVEAGGRPMIAVIIDDMGLDRKRSEKILQLPGPLTISFMSYAQDLSRQTELARSRGHELMMHVPMEPVAEGLDAGPGVLSVNLPPEELRKRVTEDLDRFTGYVGINNHMGSKFTAFAPGMELVMEELRRRGLLFIDSLTTDHSVGLTQARQAGVPAAARNVFLDNAGDVTAIDAQLAKLEDLARKKGNAIAIGHPRDGTIQALAAWLPGLRAKGLVLVPVSEVVRTRRMPAALGNGNDNRAEVSTPETQRTR